MLRDKFIHDLLPRLILEAGIRCIRCVALCHCERTGQQKDTHNDTQYKRYSFFSYRHLYFLSEKLMGNYTILFIIC